MAYHLLVLGHLQAQWWKYCADASIWYITIKPLQKVSAVKPFRCIMSPTYTIVIFVSWADLTWQIFFMTTFIKQQLHSYKNTANKICLRHRLSITPPIYCGILLLIPAFCFVCRPHLIYILSQLYRNNTSTLQYVGCNYLSLPFCKQVPIWCHVGHGWIITPTAWVMYLLICAFCSHIFSSENPYVNYNKSVLVMVYWKIFSGNSFHTVSRRSSLSLIFYWKFVNGYSNA